MINKVIIQGRLTQQPTSTCVNNKTVVNFSIANNGLNNVLFIDCVAWNKLAETIQTNCVIGQEVIVVGSFSTNEFMSKNQGKIKKTFINVSEIHFIGKKIENE